MQAGYFAIILIMLPWAGFAQTALTLEEAVALAQQQSVAAEVVKNQWENKQFAWNNFQASLRPQLGIRAGLPMYSRDFLEVRQPDGGVLFLPRAQNSSQLSLSLVQVIPGTGGVVSVHTDLVRFDDFDRGRVFYTGTPLGISLEQPLFAANPYKWARDIEPLKLEEAGKTYKFQMEALALQVVELFFNVLDAREAVQQASLNLENNQLIQSIEEKRVVLGTTSREKLLQIELQMNYASQRQQEARADLQNALLNLRSFLGIEGISSEQLVIPEAVADYAVDSAFAVQSARGNRPEFVAFGRRRLEAGREAEAARRSRFQVNLQVALGFNGAGDQFPAIFSPLKDRQRFGLGLQVPILDWGRTRALEGSAAANARVVAQSILQEEQAIQLEVCHLVKALEILRPNIAYARKGIGISEERYRLALEQYQSGKLPIVELNIARAERDMSKGNYLSALRRYWEAHFRLRQMTLYDFHSGRGL